MIIACKFKGVSAKKGKLGGKGNGNKVTSTFIVG